MSNKKYYDQNQAQLVARSRINRYLLKMEFIAAYGGKCDCCGERRKDFLTLDHIGGTGAEHRRQNGNKTGIHMYLYLKKLGWPKEGYRLLCFNCNQVLSFKAVCPHKEI